MSINQPNSAGGIIKWFLVLMILTGFVMLAALLYLDPPKPAHSAERERPIARHIHRRRPFCHRNVYDVAIEAPLHGVGEIIERCR